MEKHTLSLDDRKKLTVTGVTGVDGMDGKEVEISLESGKLVVRGEGLTVSKLDTDTGNLTVTAHNISSLVYGDKNKAGKGPLTGIWRNCAAPAPRWAAASVSCIH